MLLQIIRHQHAAFQLHGDQLADRNDLIMQFFLRDFRPFRKFFFALVMNALQPFCDFRTWVLRQLMLAGAD